VRKLVEVNGYVDVLAAHRANRRGCKFLSASPCLIADGGTASSRWSGASGAIARVHISLDHLSMFTNEPYDLVLKRPFEEVELSDGGADTGTVAVWDFGAFPSAEGIKASFFVAPKAKLVLGVHYETTARVVVIGCNGLLGIIGDEPVYEAETDLILAVDNGEDGV